MDAAEQLSGDGLVLRGKLAEAATRRSTSAMKSGFGHTSMQGR